MPIIPNQKAMQSVSGVMAQSLQDLHKIIEEECNHEHPKEILVLMVGFINSLLLQRRDKVETVGKGFGNKLLEGVHVITQPNPSERNILDQLNRQDPSLNESASGLLPSDSLGGIRYLTEKLLDDISIHLKELPFLLRNDEILLHSLSIIVARLFSAMDNNNLDENIKNFVTHIRQQVNHSGQEKSAVH